MDTAKLAPTSLTITVDWVHIRQAERRAGLGNRSLSPFTIALVEQSRYSTGRLTDDAVLMTDYDGHPVRYAASQPLRDYLEAWRRGDKVQPASFTLESAG
jgi:hypothetical protein